MSFLEKLGKLDQKFSWSFLGFIIGIIGFGFSIYTIFFFEKVPVIKYEIISNTNVLDIKENVSRLDILFDSVSVKKSGQNLRVITLKISNVGNENLNADYFDNKYPLGFQIQGAEIVQKPELLEFSNDYIRETIELTENQDNKIVFSNILIGQGEYFIVKTLTLSDTNIIPTLKPLGYISGSGVPKLVIVNEDIETTPKSFIKKLLYGHLGYHVVRFFVYIIILVLIGALFAVPKVLFEDIRLQKNKKKHILKFKQNTKIDRDDLAEKIFEYYLNYGESYLYKVQMLLRYPNKLNDYKRFLELRHEFDLLEYNLSIQQRHSPVRMANYETDKIESDVKPNTYGTTLLNELLGSRVLSIENENIEVNESFSKILEDFIYFIKIQ